ncbi:MAG: glycosyltransferase [Ahniella sp.]|nr:glycosyltransferase [Ahniella sp.]
MRVLFVTHRFPGAAFRGDQVRARAQIRELSQRHNITLLTFQRLPETHQALAAMRDLGVEVIMVPRDRLAMLLRAAWAMFSGRAIQLALFDAPALREQFAATLCALPRFDLVHLQLIRLERLIEEAHSVPVVLDLVDALSVNMSSRAESARWPVPRLYCEEGRRLARHEELAVKRVAGSVISANTDAIALGSPDRLVVAPNGVDLDEFSEGPDAAVREHLIFHGNWAYGPNQSGLRWLLRTVMPRVWQTRPDVRLRLAGANPERIRSLLGDARIDLLGQVPSPAAALQRAAVSVAPVHAGSGQSLKILEAMACGTPVVTTRRAATAIAGDGTCPCLAADDPDTFAEAILRLLDDVPDRRRLAAASRGFVESTFSWAHSNAVLESVWNQAASAMRK